MDTLDYALPSRSLIRTIRHSTAWWAMAVRGALAIAEFLLAYGLICGVLMLLSRNLPYSLLCGAICLGAIVHILHQVRHRWARRVIFHVEAAVRTGLPITDYLYVAADSEGRIVRRRLIAVADMLNHGLPLALALASAAPELSTHESRLIFAGERTGRLPQMLKRVANPPRRIVAEGEIAPGFLYRWYLPLAGVALVAVFAMMLIFVMPKFEAIMRDFGIRAPWATRIVLQTGRNPWSILMPVVLLPAFVLALREMRLALLPVNPGLELGPIDRLLGSIPLLGRLNRNRSLADICTILASDVCAGVPLTQSVREISELPLEGGMNQRVWRWRDLLEAGMPVSDAARNAGMPDLLCSILAAPGDAAGLAGSLEVVAEIYQNRHRRVRDTLESVLFPLMVLLLSAAALLMALAIFLPMMEMVNHLCDTIGGGQ